ncbi:MAG: carboxypeptidase regulatory-like domain-containing protein [Caldisericota bacterium]|nr:carboxypeptidase regulatory-like domain-containing protein [Caldisericota bacterium]
MKKIIVLVLAIVLLAGLFVGCSGGGETQPKTSTITVSVFDEDGNTLSDVSLTMGDYSGETGDSGKYMFNDVESASYTIRASKDGHEDESEDIVVSAGENKTVLLTLKKVEEEAEELKNYSSEKSYRAVMEGQLSPGGINRIIIEHDNYGNSQHLTIYDEDEKEFEMYIVDDKAKTLMDNEWMDVPLEQVQVMLSTGYLNLPEAMASGAAESYNTAITTPDFSYGVEKIGRETVNGYPTTKYHMFSKITSEEETGTSDIWIINSGSYKGYATRMVVTIKSSGEEETFTINITDLGKDMGIQMP